MKRITLLCLLLGIASPANAVCIFGIGTTCSIDHGTAAALLRPRINGKLMGQFRFEQTILLDTLRHGQPGVKAGENERRLARANAIRAHMSGTKACQDIESVWDAELPFDKGKQEFCELARLMKARHLASLELSIGQVQPTSAGSAKQDMFLRFAMTEDGQAKAEKFLISRDAESITLATGALNLLRIVGNDGGALVAMVEFQYEVVPNVWTHVEKRLPRDTLAAERRVGNARFQKLGEQWRLIHEPVL